MKTTKLIAAAMSATLALAIAGSAGAAQGHGSHGAASARFSSNAGGRASLASPRQRNRRFASSYQSFPYYPSYGNAVYLNPDEADWSEQWTSLYEDNDGPYARSTLENAPGQARMWEFPEK
jgi:hypothetical protein